MPIYLYLMHPVWTEIFFISFAGYFAIGMWAAQRERNLSKGENRDRGSRTAVYVFSFLALGLAFTIPNVVPASRIALPAAAVFAVAIAMIWGGIGLYVWSVQTLGAFFRTTVTLLEGQRLVTRGPYRLLRHPAYTGGILILSGIGLATGNWVSFAAASLAAAIGYSFRIRVEEVALRERFGAEFEANRKRTWAVLPPIW